MKESEKVQAEYEAFWDCPKCNERTYGSDHEHITHNDGSYLRIECAHMVDKGGDDFELCGHEYRVDMNP